MSRIHQDLAAIPLNAATSARDFDADMIRRVLPKGYVPHICVIGAGMSGLRCAEVLIEKGLKVTILEGRNRIGGRVHQSSQLGHLVDLGPNWIHGTDHNPILDLAKETNTAVFSSGEGGSVFDDQGCLMPQEKAKKHSELVWGIISDAFKYSNEQSDTIPPDRSLMEFFETKIKEKDLNGPSSRLVLQMARIWGDFVGDPIERQSLKYFWLEECIDGENLFVASTYRSVLSHVAKAVLAKATLALSTVVTSITSDPPTSQNNENPTVTVTTAGQTTHNFDEVVMTAPLGWLKRNHTSAFTPPLPPRLQSAISNISYGRLEKVYITFSTAFWLENTSPPYPFFTQFLSPTYAETTNPDHWALEFVSLASLPPPQAHPTLLFYIHGPCATHITSLISPHSPSSEIYRSLLDEFFQPYYSLLPNYDPSSCTPVAILATNWQNDEMAGCGSYTNFQVSSPPNVNSPPNANQPSNATSSPDPPDHPDPEAEVRLDEDIKALRYGCPERGLWFAGEHTAPFVALGTVTGAYWSGENVGRRVCEAYLGVGVDGEEGGAAVEN